MSEATFCVNYDPFNTFLALRDILYLPKRGLNFSENIQQCTVISTPPYTDSSSRLLSIMQECKRIFQNEYHLWVSVPAATQVANDTTVLQGILQRGSPHRQNPVPAPQTHTCGTSPKPRYPHDAMCDMRQSLEATQSFIFELSERSKGTEPPGKRTRLTFPSARVDLCQQEHY